MLLRSLRFGFLRDEAQGGAQGGGGAGGAGAGGSQQAANDPAAELANLRRENAAFKQAQREASEKEERSKGEWNNVIKRYEGDVTAERDKASKAEKERDEFKAKYEGMIAEGRKGTLRGAVAQTLGVADDAILKGLFAQVEGLDLAPEKLDDAHTKKVADAVLKLAPSLKPAGRAAGAAGSGPVGGDGKITDWHKFGRQLAGKE